MDVAAATFFSLPELLRLLAEQVRNHKQLAKLRLTSRAFAAAAVPSLFCAVRVGKKGSQSLHELSACGHLRYVRKLTVEDGIGRDFYDAIVQRFLLPRMPRLESLTWRDMPLTSATLRVLHESCPLVTAIHVTFPRKFGDQKLGYAVGLEHREPEPWPLEARETHGRLDLTVFSGLEELTLYNLYGELPWWRSQLAQVLRKNASSMRKLALSVSPDTLLWYAERGEPAVFVDFFDRLGDDHGAAPVPPLRLRSLVLGTGVCAHQLSSLEKLTDLACLRDVHVANDDAVHDVQVVLQLHDLDAVYEYRGIAFHAFGPARCPKLRRFTAARYRPDVQALLAGGGTADDRAWARRLAVSCGRMGDGFELAALLRGEHGSAPLRLRMLDVDLARGSVRLFDEEGGVVPADEVPSAEQVLADLVAGDDGALEGLAVHMAEERGPGRGYQFRDLGLLTAALAQLAGLTQLAVQLRSGFVSKLTEAQLADAARVIAAAAPHVQYVKVHCSCWRVLRDAGGGGEEAVRLEVLDDWEAAGVELFSHSIWTP